MSASAKAAHARRSKESYHWLRHRKGETASQWKGNRAQYGAIHTWLRKHHPKTGICEVCGDDERRTVYAYKHHPKPPTRERADYLEACYSCHNRMDDIIANLN